MGDGLWYLGSASNNIGQQGSFNGASLSAGLGNAYRLGAGGSTLNFGSDLVRANVITDSATGAANRLIVGSPVGGNSAVGNASGTVMFHTSQNYTGSTLINRNSTLDFRGRLSTPVFENYGTLVVSDTGTFVNNAGTANTASFQLRPGSELRFDNANGGLPDVSVVSGRWHDSAPMTLDSATLRMTGSLTTDVIENVGALTVRGGAAVLVQRGLQARYAGVNFASLVQAADVSVAGTSIIGNNGTLTLASLAGTASNANGSFGTPLQLGGDERVTVSGGVSVTGGIAPAWIWNGQNPLLTGNADTYIAESVSASFLAYGSAGFVPAGWTAVTGGSGATTAIDGSTFAGPTDRAFINSIHSDTNTTTLTNNLDVFALRVDSPRGDKTRNLVGAGSETITIRSGGLISSGGEVVEIRPPLVFGASTASPVVAYVHVANARRSDTTSEAVGLAFRKRLRFRNHRPDLRDRAGQGRQRGAADHQSAVHVGLLRQHHRQRGQSAPSVPRDQRSGFRRRCRRRHRHQRLRVAAGPHLRFDLRDRSHLPEQPFHRREQPLALIANTTGTSGYNNIGSLAFGGITGADATPESREQGQTLQVTGSGTTSLGLRVTGTTNLGPIGNVFFRPATDSIADITLAGLVTGSGTMVAAREGGGSRVILSNLASANNWTGGTVMMGRTLEVWASAAQCRRRRLLGDRCGRLRRGCRDDAGGHAQSPRQRWRRRRPRNPDDCQPLRRSREYLIGHQPGVLHRNRQGRRPYQFHRRLPDDHRQYRWQ